MNTSLNDRDVRWILRCEAVAGLLASLLLYARTDGDWLLFAALVLIPDLSMFGYLAGPRIGQFYYNIAHSTTLPWLVFAAGTCLALPAAAAVALIWIAHIFFDRALGFGLKYKTGFADTHLGPAAAPIRPRSTG
jgi:hypothetical protein